MKVVSPPTHSDQIEPYVASEFLKVQNSELHNPKLRNIRLGISFYRKSGIPTTQSIKIVLCRCVMCMCDFLGEKKHFHRDSNIMNLDGSKYLVGEHSIRHKKVPTKILFNHCQFFFKLWGVFDAWYCPTF